MDNGGSCKVMEACAQRWEPVACTSHCCQETVRAPGPVTDDGVNETCNRNTVEEVANKCSTANHGAGGDRRTGVGKGELEDPYGQEGYACSFISRRRILQEEPVVADESIAVAEHECEA